MSKLIDLTGKKFGKWSVISRGYKPNDKNTYWLCMCDCGTIRLVDAADLKSGKSTNCGCVRKCKIGALNRTHGFSHKERLYSIWRGMKQRCHDKKCINYNDYGGRGISVCEEWNGNYLSFRNWALSNGYADNLTIDRIDSNGNYDPDNCQWNTYKEQSKNKRNSASISTDKSIKIAKSFSSSKIKYGAYYSRIKRGWCISDANNIPKLHKERGIDGKFVSGRDRFDRN